MSSSSLFALWRHRLPPLLLRLALQLYEVLRSVQPRDHLEALTPVQRAAGFARFVFDRFHRARSLQSAGSLTCTTLFAMVPLLTLALTVLTAFAAFRQLLARVRELLMSQLLPEAGSRIIALYVSHFSNNAGQLRLAGTLVLVVAAVTAMMTVDRAFAEIWRVRARRPLATRLVTYWLLLIFGPLLIGIALTLSTSLFKAWLGVAHGVPWIPRSLLKLLPVLAVITVLTAVYRWLPHRHVPGSHALAGGLIAGLAFELMKWLFSFYVHHFPGYTLIYGAFAAFPIFLLWIYLSWAVVLGGAVLTASLPHWHGDAWRVPRDHPDQRFRDALQVLRVLMGQGDVALALPRLQRRVMMGYDDLETVIEPLAAAGLLAARPEGAWQASALAWTATVGDIWVLFHRGPLAGGHWSGDAELREVSEILDALPARELGLPLARLVLVQ
jgi:membrane protein